MIFDLRFILSTLQFKPHCCTVSMMTYDDFIEKLREIKAEFKRAKRTDLITIEQLEHYLTERKSRRSSRGLKSLKGLDL